MKYLNLICHVEQYVFEGDVKRKDIKRSQYVQALTTRDKKYQLKFEQLY